MTLGTGILGHGYDGTRSVRAIEHLVTLDVGRRRVSAFGDELDVPTDAHVLAELSAWLYLRLHAGNPLACGVDAIRPDFEFEAMIRERVPRRSLGVSSAQAPTRAGDDLVLFDLDRVWVGMDAPPGQSEPVLEISCARPNLSPGFFMFVHDMDTTLTGHITRLYVAHDDPSAALVDWVGCIEQLIDRDLPFRTKILSRRRCYPRNDAVVFYAGERGDDIAQVIDEAVDGAVDGRAHARRSKSVFCRRLVGSSGGVTIAAEPVDRHSQPGTKSFGEHRCDALARAIVRVLDGSAHETLGEAIEQECMAANIDPDDFSRNLR